MLINCINKPNFAREEISAALHEWFPRSHTKYNQLHFSTFWKTNPSGYATYVHHCYGHLLLFVLFLYIIRQPHSLQRMGSRARISFSWWHSTSNHNDSMTNHKFNNLDVILQIVIVWVWQTSRQVYHKRAHNCSQQTSTDVNHCFRLSRYWSFTRSWRPARCSGRCHWHGCFRHVRGY